MGKYHMDSCCVIDTSKGVLIPLSKGYNSIETNWRYKEKRMYFKAKKFYQNVTDIYDENGRLIKHYPYSSVDEWGDDYLIVSLNNNKGIINLDGQILLNPEYNQIGWIDNNRACVYKSMTERKAYIIDLNSGNIINSNWSTVRRQEEDNGCMVVTKWVNGKEYSGIVDSNYNEILSPCNCNIMYSLISKEFEITNKETKEMKKIAYEELKQK